MYTYWTAGDELILQEFIDRYNRLEKRIDYDSIIPFLSESRSRKALSEKARQSIRFKNKEVPRWTPFEEWYLFISRGLYKIPFKKLASVMGRSSSSLRTYYWRMDM